MWWIHVSMHILYVNFSSPIHIMRGSEQPLLFRVTSKCCLFMVHYFLPHWESIIQKEINKRNRKISFLAIAW